MIYKRIFYLVLFTACTFSLAAQETSPIALEKCGTMPRLNAKFARDPSLKGKFELQRSVFNQQLTEVLNNKRLNNDGQNNRLIGTIPVVFHIVMPDPSVVTDAQILAQLDALNKDYFGINGDSVKIPSWFKPLFGKSGIQFCLAQRTPTGDISTGVDRVTTNQASFNNTTDGVKHASLGGRDIWDGNRYYNVWITTLTNGIVGYGTFPDDNQTDEQGVVIDYRSLPGGSFAGFNTGKTLTHETGHYFNLYHIWGDDNGACTGSDFVDDTPNQANSTSGCFTGIRTDNCTTGGNGVMYENYMDYSNDNCLIMFTLQQVTRMESALSVYRSSLLSSDACQPVILRNYDAQLQFVVQPYQRVCAPAFTPVITVRNGGAQTLTSLVIRGRVDDGPIVTTNWTGSIARLATANITLSPLNTATGQHTLKIYVTSPNNTTDENPANDTLAVSIQYYEPVTSISESFEGSTFPPQGWDIVNTDKLLTWSRITPIAKTGNASVMMDNYSGVLNDRKDDLRLPDVSLAATIDSAFFSFQVAAAVRSASNIPDTLEVLVSLDCGQTYTSIYKKYGSNLVTRTASTTNAFAPAAIEWRRDSINLAAYIGRSTILIAFRNTTENGNNIYLDDVNLRTVTINPNLKTQGFLVTPNPVRSAVAIQFYPQPTNLRALQIFN
ncbi:MAG: M43 family zinc metalloprotease, partial [Sediminibacterium sp.]